MAHLEFTRFIINYSWPMNIRHSEYVYSLFLACHWRAIKVKVMRKNRNRFDRPFLSMASKWTYFPRKRATLCTIFREQKETSNKKKSTEFYVVRFAFKWPFVVRLWIRYELKFTCASRRSRLHFWICMKCRVVCRCLACLRPRNRLPFAYPMISIIDEKWMAFFVAIIRLKWQWTWWRLGRSTCDM